MKGRVLLVGESWVSATTHYKGFNQFVSGGYETGVEWFGRAMAGRGVEWEHMPTHEAQAGFPTDAGELKRYAAIILSDVGSDTFLLHPRTWLLGERTPNRLRVIADYVREGGGLVMAGGYLSYQGINGAARYHRTPVEEALPVEIQPYDDRVECPEGVQPKVLKTSHPITGGLPDFWPHLLGYNLVTPKKGADVLAMVGDDPLLVAWAYGKGRSVAWTSDIGPHWCSRMFAEWDGYGELWSRMLGWASWET